MIGGKICDSQELIETLWNVNQICLIGGNGFCAELIETLWNVNFYNVKMSHLSFAN